MNKNYSRPISRWTFIGITRSLWGLHANCWDCTRFVGIARALWGLHANCGDCTRIVGIARARYWRCKKRKRGNFTALKLPIFNFTALKLPTILQKIFRHPV